MTLVDLALDADGYPVILAEPSKVPRLREGVVDKSEKVDASPVLSPSTRPTTVDYLEWSRRQDAVRDAAREFETLSQQDLRERMRGATSKPLDDGDLEQFTVDVRAAVIDDLVDVLDQGTRGKLRGRRTVRVNAPRGYIAKTAKSLTDAEVMQVEARLRARGWSDAQITSDLTPKLPLPKKIVSETVPKS